MLRNIEQFAKEIVKLASDTKLSKSRYFLNIAPSIEILKQSFTHDFEQFGINTGETFFSILVYQIGEVFCQKHFESRTRR